MSNSNDILKIIKPLKRNLFENWKISITEIYEKANNKLINLQHFIDGKNIFELVKYKNKLLLAKRLNCEKFNTESVSIALFISVFSAIIALLSYIKDGKNGIEDFIGYFALGIILIIVGLKGIRILMHHRIVAGNDYMYDRAIEMIEEEIKKRR